MLFSSSFSDIENPKFNTSIDLKNEENDGNESEGGIERGRERGRGEEDLLFVFEFLSSQ